MRLIWAWLLLSQSIDIRIVKAVTDTDTTTSRKWALINCPVRASVRVYTGQNWVGSQYDDERD
jgi:hypothetical protein